MFWFRRLRPPLTTFQRVDIELLMRRTIEMIGADRVRRSQIVSELDELALDRSSPQRLLQSATTALQDRLPTMHPPAECFARNGEDLGYPATYQAAGNGNEASIQIAKEVLADPLRTVMELAYQYATHYWHQVEHPAPLDRDPRTTNLLPICCGLGILASDACLYDQQWSQAGYSGWSISRSGYYTAAEIGYAMSLLSRFRRDDDPAWLSRLRLDSRVTTKQACRYFAEQQRRGRPLLFDAERIPSSSSDQKQLADWLSGDDPSFALAAAYALCKRDELSDQVIESAVLASRSSDRDLVPIATQLLGRGREFKPAVRQRITELMFDGHPPTALAAMLSAQAVGIPLKGHRPLISKLLDLFAQDSFSLLEVVGKQGTDFASLEPQVCEHLVRAIRASDDELALALIQCLRRIAEEPRQAIEKRIQSKVIREEALQRFDAAV